MPRTRLAITFFVASSISLAACAADTPMDEDPAADAAAAEAVLGDFFRSMESWDYDALLATVTSDFELVEDTVIMSMDEFIAYIRPFQEQGGEMRWTLTDHHTEVDGDVAWTRYTNRAVLDMDGQQTRFHWIESAVFNRDPDSGWKIDRLQSTPVTVEGAMAPAH